MKAAKVFKLKTRYSVNEVYVVKSAYCNNDTLYVGLYDVNGEPFDTVTTNIGTPGATDTCAYVQTGDECGYNRVAWLIQHGIAQTTGKIAVSGWNTYSLMDFSASLADMCQLR